MKKDTRRGSTSNLLSPASSTGTVKKKGKSRSGLGALLSPKPVARISVAIPLSPLSTSSSMSETHEPQIPLVVGNDWGVNEVHIMFRRLHKEVERLKIEMMRNREHLHQLETSKSSYSTTQSARPFSKVIQQHFIDNSGAVENSDVHLQEDFVDKMVEHVQSTKGGQDMDRKLIVARMISNKTAIKSQMTKLKSKVRMAIRNTWITALNTLTSAFTEGIVRFQNEPLVVMKNILDINEVDDDDVEETGNFLVDFNTMFQHLLFTGRDMRLWACDVITSICLTHKMEVNVSSFAMILTVGFMTTGISSPKTRLDDEEFGKLKSSWQDIITVDGQCCILKNAILKEELLLADAKFVKMGGYNAIQAVASKKTNRWLFAACNSVECLVHHGDHCELKGLKVSRKDELKTKFLVEKEINDEEKDEDDEK